MINKDYILRLAERIGRELSILLGLRRRNAYEEAHIYIDDLLLKTVGLTTRFIHSLSEETLLQMLSPLGKLNVESCLWVASLLKVEGEIYQEQGESNEAYYSFRKSLYLFLVALRHEPVDPDSEFSLNTDTLLTQLEDYELPTFIKSELMLYYEHIGHYARAEDVLFELLEALPHDRTLIDQGRDFYARLLAKDDEELLAGNFSREEVQEGLDNPLFRRGT